jgi:hypothetical protein
MVNMAILTIVLARETDARTGHGLGAVQARIRVRREHPAMTSIEEAKSRAGGAAGGASCPAYAIEGPLLNVADLPLGAVSV